MFSSKFNNPFFSIKKAGKRKEEKKLIFIEHPYRNTYIGRHFYMLSHLTLKIAFFSRYSLFSSFKRLLPGICTIVVLERILIVCEGLESGHKLPKDMFCLACNTVLKSLSQFPV